MKKTLILSIIIAVMSGCSSIKNGSQQDTQQSPILKTTLAAASKEFTKDSIMLSFTVVNESDTTLRFCKWETPFDPGIGKYMDIADAQGEEPSFIGAMARRVMPPPAESYLEVPPNDSLTTVFNLADSYAMDAGQYSVRFSGGAMGDFTAGNEIKITIVRK